MSSPVLRFVFKYIYLDVRDNVSTAALSDLPKMEGRISKKDKTKKQVLSMTALLGRILILNDLDQVK